MTVFWRGLVLSALLGASGLSVARELVICMLNDDLPPVSLVAHEGQGQWLVREALQRAGHSVRFVLAPWARCIEGIKHAHYEALLGAGANPDNLLLMRFPEVSGQVDRRQRLGSITQVVLRRVGASVEWDGRTFSGVTTAVMYRRGYASIKNKLADLGVAGDDNSNAEEQTVEKLLLDRGDAAIVLLESAQALLEQDKYRAKVEILPLPFLELPLYLAVNRQAYAASPEFFDALWDQIRTLRGTPEWQAVAPALAR